jgi:hypothetical protein
MVKVGYNHWVNPAAILSVSVSSDMYVWRVVVRGAGNEIEVYFGPEAEARAVAEKLAIIIMSKTTLDATGTPEPSTSR